METASASLRTGLARADDAIRRRLRMPRLQSAWYGVRAAYTDIFVDDWGPRRWLRARIFSLVFLGFLIGPIQQVVASNWSRPQQVFSIIGIATFAACFAVTIWRNTPTLHDDRSPYTVAVAIAVGITLFATGLDWLTGLSTYTIAMLLFNYGRRLWLPIVVGVPAADILLDQIVTGRGFRDSIMVAAPVALIGAVQAAFYNQIRAKVELAHARTDLARLAVSEERLRIARDLHDILGQRLSAVSLKSELAARLVDRDPARAATEMVEVAEVARQALADVRETVSGYRALTLGAEVETARALLGAAGLSVDLECNGEPLPLELDECAGALVREAVTNVIRHASAKRCVIRIRRDGEAILVEVRDTGVTPPGAVAVAYGNGLTGLAERVERVGGALWIGRETGDFVVRATLPCGRSTAPTQSPSVRAARAVPTARRSAVLVAGGAALPPGPSA